MPNFGAIQANHVQAAAQAIIDGASHPFGISTRFDVVVGERRFPPKAIVGLAHRIATGSDVTPSEFNAGDNWQQANTILSDLGFAIIDKNWSDEEDELLVANYFDMYGRVLAGEEFVKMDEHRALADRLNRRTIKSIKRKLENVSACLVTRGLRPMPGFVPSSNIQAELDDAVTSYLARNPTWSRRIAESSETEPTQYWSFFSDLNEFRTEDALAAYPEITFTVSRGSPKPGDRAIIWRGADRGGRRGIIALCEVMTEPVEMPEAPHLLPYWNGAGGQEIRNRLWLRRLDVPGLPLWLDQDTSGTLAALSVARARGGTVFNLTQEQWNSIRRLTNAPAAPSPSLPRRGGQRFGGSPEVNAAVEQYAMDKAMEYFSTQHFQVVDVHDTQSFDLLCSHADAGVLRVEVKGTRSAGEEVFLTRNEVELMCSDPAHAVLFVVHSIVMTRVDGHIQLSGGVTRILRPWHLDRGALTPIQYTYRLPQ